MPSKDYLENLLVEARARRDLDPVAAMTLFERVAEAAVAAGYRLVAADAWLAYGETVSLVDGRERESLLFIRRAAELAPQSAVAALAWLTAGEILKFCGEIDQAADAYSEAVTLFESLSDAWGECLARHALSEVLVSLGRAEEAVEGGQQGGRAV